MDPLTAVAQVASGALDAAVALRRDHGLDDDAFRQHLVRVEAHAAGRVAVLEALDATGALKRAGIGRLVRLRVLLAGTRETIARLDAS